ncbi:hypothetical protein BY458DRAFT_124054 [Sporodiniella umbellata]|nr:hypothetical protein BY458DRAFT_124054 [Sporodiniella umbellata]
MTHPSLTVNSLRLAHLAYRQSRNEQAHATPQPPVFNPASTEITYRKEYKQLILPAGLLSRITLDQPDYLYTGVLGWMIAQAIMPALDRPLPVDPHCLIRQYSRFGLDIAHTTLERDKIDNTALIFHAVSNVSLPGLAAWTPAQLFYIQFARSQCTKTLPHYNWTETSPNSYRVNIPLMNSAHFASTFQCKLGTWMHPKENCQIPHTKN